MGIDYDYEHTQHCEAQPTSKLNRLDQKVFPLHAFTLEAVMALIEEFLEFVLSNRTASFLLILTDSKFHPETLFL